MIFRRLSTVGELKGKRSEEFVDAVVATFGSGDSKLATPNNDSAI
jgi:DNA polymerase sigma